MKLLFLKKDRECCFKKKEEMCLSDWNISLTKEKYKHKKLIYYKPVIGKVETYVYVCMECDLK